MAERSRHLKEALSCSPAARSGRVASFSHSARRLLALHLSRHAALSPLGVLFFTPCAAGWPWAAPSASPRSSACARGAPATGAAPPRWPAPAAAAAQQRRPAAGAAPQRLAVRTPGAPAPHRPAPGAARGRRSAGTSARGLRKLRCFGGRRWMTE